MRFSVPIGLLLILGSSFFAWASTRSMVRVIPGGGATVVVRRAPEWKLPPTLGTPLKYDCNNPLVWDGDTLYSFTSHEHPYRSAGTSLTGLKRFTTPVQFDTPPTPNLGGRWAEAVYKSGTGRLYMWYHNEPKGLFPGHPNPFLTAPRIGQMVSDDNGLHWHDQGITLEAPRSSFDDKTTNLYFGGGYGDLSVIADAEDLYLYAFVSTYHRDVNSQGIALARMETADLDDPAGKWTFWSEGRWVSPPPDGRVPPIFQAESNWHRAGSRAFWGAAVHWNSYLQAFVVVMNRATDSSFGQEGVYLTMNSRLDEPTAWTQPVKILSSKAWYPQVIGTDSRERETDRLAGRVARLFVRGESTWEIEFLKSE